MLKGKKILLGITGSIAAYKSAILVREFIKAGAEVQVILTTSASAFITPLTLSTLSNRPVLTEFTNSSTGEWHSHVELGLWADIFIIAPSTANTISKMANGICDNLLLATYLSARCAVMVVPAMDLDMYQHPSFLNNLSLLRSFGNYIIEAEHGELASGLVGQGRMAEPNKIVECVSNFFLKNETLKGVKVLISAGPTQEAIDPVRYISNHSTGKMGFALAEAMALRGAEVVLVTGPTNLKIENQNIKQINVVSADEMYCQMDNYFSDSKMIIFAAAVADYTPKDVSLEKIKKSEATLTIDLIKNKDIAFELSNKKLANQITIGFALETNNEVQNALGKLERKNFDFIVLNSLKDEKSGFGFDTNKVSVFGKNNLNLELSLRTKKEISNSIIDFVLLNIS